MEPSKRTDTIKNTRNLKKMRRKSRREKDRIEGFEYWIDSICYMLYSQEWESTWERREGERSEKSNKLLYVWRVWLLVQRRRFLFFSLFCVFSSCNSTHSFYKRHRNFRYKFFSLLFSFVHSQPAFIHCTDDICSLEKMFRLTLLQLIYSERD